MPADLAAPVYSAFISYSTEDKPVAERLQKRLEDYEIPKGLGQGEDPPRPPIGPRLRKVFRDRTDLASGLLGEAIEEALRQSEALIVLCSPRGMKSEWVDKEIIAFKSLGKGRRIFPVILDGEPYAAGKTGFTADHECFPAALRHAVRDGRLTEEPEPAPLAADFRAGQDGERIGFLKIVAGLLGVRLDDLTERELRAERMRLRMAQRNEARVVNALGRVMAERAWAAMEGGDPPLAIRYALAGLKATPANREEFRAALGAVLHAADRSRLLHGYDGKAAAAALSPNGTRAVSARDGKPPRLVEADSGREIAILRGHKGRVYYAAFSPDGRRLVTGGVDDTARIWDAATGGALAVLPHPSGGLRDVSFNADGARLMAGQFGDRAQVWDTDSWRLVATLGSDAHGVQRGPKLSPDGARVVAPTDKPFDGWNNEPRAKTAQVWDAATGAEIATLRGHRATIRAVAYSPDGTLIVTGSDDNTARVWRSGGRNKLVLGGHAGPVTGAVFSPDGSRLLTVASDGARVWDANDGVEMFILRGHGDKVNDAAYSPDGKRIVTASEDMTVRLWEAATGEEAGVLRGHVGPVASASFTPDGGRVVATSRDGVARIWDAPGGEDSATPPAPDVPGRQLARSPDGTLLVVLSRAGKAHVVEAASGRDVAILSAPALEWGKVSSAVFTPDSRRILTSSWSRLVLWDAAEGRLLATLNGHEGDAGSVVFNADASVIAAVSYDGKVRVWTSSGGEPSRALHALSEPNTGAPLPDAAPDGLMGAEERVQEVALSPDGSRILAIYGYGDKASARAWAVASGTIVGKEVRLDVSRPAGAAFSPDNARVAVISSDGTVPLFELASGAITSVLRLRESRIVSLAFGPDGTRVLTRSSDGAARIWAASNGRMMAALGDPNEAIAGAAFTADGTRVAALSADGVSRLWDVRRLTEGLDALKLAAANFLLPRPGSRTFSPTEIAADPLIRDVWLRDGRRETTDICLGIRGAPPMEHSGA